MRYKVTVEVADPRIVRGLIHIMHKMIRTAVDGDELMASISKASVRDEKTEDMKYKVIVENIPDHVAAQWVVDLMRKNGLEVRYEEQEEED